MSVMACVLVTTGLTTVTAKSGWDKVNVLG